MIWYVGQRLGCSVSIIQKLIWLPFWFTYLLDIRVTFKVSNHYVCLHYFIFLVLCNTIRCAAARRLVFLLWLVIAFLQCHTANLRTNIMDFKGFDSSIILILWSGIPRPIGNFPESLSQAILVGVILVGRLGVPACIFLFGLV